MNVVFYEAFSEEQEEIKHRLNSSVKSHFFEKPIQAYGDHPPEASLVSIRTQSVIPPTWKSHLRGVLTRSTGYDHIHPHFSHSLPCGYLPDYCARSVAEHALGMILSLLKRFKSQIRHFDDFDRNGITGHECLGKNLLVIGVGKIGSEMVELGRGVGMKVKGVDLVKRIPSLEYISLEEGIGWADIIVCALSLTHQTEKLLNRSTLQKARKGTIFINISRGEISPLEDLSQLLSDGILGGVGLDVFDGEAMLAEELQKGSCPSVITTLRAMDQVILTPHNAFNTVESLARKAEQSCHSIQYFMDNQTFPNPIPNCGEEK